MSTDWGYTCLDCNEDTDTWFNHGEAKLTEYFEAYTLLVDKLKQWQWVELTLLGGGYAIDEINSFLDKHKGHHIALKNEYGGAEEIKSTEPPETLQEPHSDDLTLRGA
jgi:hypothetical protein